MRYIWRNSDSILWMRIGARNTKSVDKNYSLTGGAIIKPASFYLFVTTVVVVLGINLAHANYYVNDCSIEGDVYCTAIGNNDNNGLTAETPKASIQAILDAYDIGPSDTIYIDTGYYLLASEVFIDILDGGDSIAPMTIKGSTHPDGTILALQASSGSVIRSSASYVVLENLRLTGATNGAGFAPYDGDLHGDGAHTVIRNSWLYGNKYGVWLYWGPDYTTVQNCLIYNNSTAGIYAYSMGTWAENTVILNNTIIAAGADALYLKYRISGVTLYNNIIQASGSGKYVIHNIDVRVSSLSSNYNNLYAADGALVGYYDDGFTVVCATLDDWRIASGQDAHSLSVAPLFADPNNGDYHLKSEGGRWNPNTLTWVYEDDVTSLCVDSGNPDSNYSNESTPNGQRINMGTYGGTDQASKAPPGRRLVVLNPNGGESISGTAMVYWLYQGTEWDVGDTLLLEYSGDAGQSWSSMELGDAITYSEEFFLWDTNSAIPKSGARFLWRVTYDQNELVSDVSDAIFTLHNEPVSYYINDDSTINDIYTTTIGNNLNDGGSPSSPKASLSTLLSDRNLESSDTIYMDTGHYPLTSEVFIDILDGGDSIAPMTIKGSTHPDGTILTLQASSGSVIRSSASYVVLENLRLTGATNGAGFAPYDGDLHGDGAHTVIRNSWLYGNKYGVWLYWGPDYTTVQNCLIYNNSTAGIYAYSAGTWAENTLILNNSIIAAGADALRFFDRISGVTLYNNIVQASGSGKYTVYSNKVNNLFSNYNNLYATNGAFVGYHTVACETLDDWRIATGQDTHSLSVDPLFFDLNNGDYHLKSEAGRWYFSTYTELDPTSDGFINLLDFTAFADSWCKRGGFIPADLDRSGTVDFSDLKILLDNYLKSYALGEWGFDDVTSPCIDAGDPNSDWTRELWPHGKMINMGAYGGTPQASMSLSKVGSIANLDNDPCDIVDFNDLELFIGKWLKEEILIIEDLNRDGMVNFFDYALFANHWLE